MTLDNEKVVRVHSKIQEKNFQKKTTVHSPNIQRGCGLICKQLRIFSWECFLSNSLFSELLDIFGGREYNFRLPKIFKRFRKGVWGITLLQKGFPQLFVDKSALKKQLIPTDKLPTMKPQAYNAAVVSLVHQAFASIKFQRQEIKYY